MGQDAHYKWMNAAKEVKSSQKYEEACRVFESMPCLLLPAGAEATNLPRARMWVYLAIDSKLGIWRQERGSAKLAAFSVFLLEADPVDAAEARVYSACQKGQNGKTVTELLSRQERVDKTASNDRSD